tara:strand:- start:1578 stop:1730 length:153 start_codon:yes stop_codon:yes gene_type:complete
MAYHTNNKHATGGGNKKKGIPPTSTNYYGLVSIIKTTRNKAGMYSFLKKK